MEVAFHEGTLQTKKGSSKWTKKHFKVFTGRISWSNEAADEQEEGSLHLSANTVVRVPQFGLKKFTFEVDADNQILKLAASGEAEKLDWLQAIERGSGLQVKSNGAAVIEKVGRVTQGTMGRSKQAGVNKPESKPEDLESILSSIEKTAQNAKSINPAVAERVQEKLLGNLSFVASSTGSKCVVCTKKIFSIEEVVVDAKKMHKDCFRCAHCDQKLAVNNFECINDKYYCRHDYLELFKQSKPSSEFNGIVATVKKLSKRLSSSKKGFVKSDDKSKPVEKEIPAWKMEFIQAKERSKSMVVETPKVEEPKKTEVVKRLSASKLATVMIGFGRPPTKNKDLESNDLEDELNQLETVKNEKIHNSEDEDTEEDEEDEEEDEEPQEAKIVPEEKSKSEEKQAKMLTTIPRVSRKSTSESSPELNHAVMNRPVMKPRRRPPTTTSAEPKSKLTHDLTFKVDGGSGSVITCHASSASEREQWIKALSNATYVRHLELKLKTAQRKDMMSALQSQAELENFVKTAVVEYHGYLEKLSGKKGWKKHYFVLKDFELSYFSNAKKKKPVGVVKLNDASAVMDIQHRILKPEL